MWRQRGTDKLSSLKLRHSELEEFARRNKLPLNDDVSNAITKLSDKIDSLSDQIKSIQDRPYSLNVGSLNNESIIKSEEELVPMFIPSLNLDDKKLSNDSKVESRKKRADLNSAVSQLQKVKDESY